MSRGPSTLATNSVTARMFWVSDSFAPDSSGPGACPALTLSMARWLFHLATWKPE